MPLNPDTVRAYSRSFFGYGNPAAKWWFIGTEEGGGKSMQEVNARIDEWHDRGEGNVEPLRGFACAVRHGLDRYFRNRFPTEPTWRCLIRAMLSARGQINGAPHNGLDLIREYQRDHWGSPDGETFISEVLPLPCPSTQIWHYGSWWQGSPVPDFVENRQANFEFSAESRGFLFNAYFANTLTPPSPRIIIIYAQFPVYHRWLFNVLELDVLDFQPRLQDPNTYIARADVHDAPVLIVGTHHPTARRNPAGYWNGVGEFIAEFAQENNLLLP